MSLLARSSYITCKITRMHSMQLLSVLSAILQLPCTHKNVRLTLVASAFIFLVPNNQQPAAEAATKYT